MAGERTWREFRRAEGAVSERRGEEAGVATDNAITEHGVCSRSGKGERFSEKGSTVEVVVKASERGQRLY